VDIYVYSSGEWFSQLIRRGFLPFASGAGGRSPDGIEDGESLYLENLQNILKMTELYRAGNYKDALATFDGLPGKLKRNRNILMQRFAIAVGAGGAEYDTAMHDLKTAFPDDPSLGLVLIDYHFNRGEYDQSLELIARLNEAVGGDPYLNFLRASVLFAAGRLDEAKLAARRAIEAEPALADPYWALLTISLQQKEFAETARLLTEIETALEVEFEDLSGFPDYREFVASEAYTSWVAERAVGD
jgi:tetratricopeptide (TPR) repeat protein